MPSLQVAVTLCTLLNKQPTMRYQWLSCAHMTSRYAMRSDDVSVWTYLSHEWRWKRESNIKLWLPSQKDSYANVVFPALLACKHCCSPSRVAGDHCNEISRPMCARAPLSGISANVIGQAGIGPSATPQPLLNNFRHATVQCNIIASKRSLEHIISKKWQEKSHRLPAKCFIHLVETSHKECDPLSVQQNANYYLIDHKCNL